MKGSAQSLSPTSQFNDLGRYSAQIYGVTKWHHKFMGWDGFPIDQSIDESVKESEHRAKSSHCRLRQFLRSVSLPSDSE